MRLSIFPKYDVQQTNALCEFLSELGEDLSGPAIPIAMTLWTEEKPIMLVQGYWEYSTGFTNTIYLARRSAQVSGMMRGAVVLCIIAALEAFGDKETLALYEKPLKRVRRYCYLNITLRDLPYYLTYPNPAPVVAVGVEGSSIYFRTGGQDGQWVNIDGDVVSVNPSWVIEITE